MQKILKSVEVFQSYVLPLFHILRVHYGWEMDCFILQGRVSTLFRWGGYIFFHVCLYRFFLLTAVQKLQKSNVFFQSYDHKCTATFFSVHSVQSTSVMLVIGITILLFLLSSYIVVAWLDLHPIKLHPVSNCKLYDLCAACFYSIFMFYSSIKHAFAFSLFQNLYFINCMVKMGSVPITSRQSDQSSLWHLKTNLSIHST